MAYGKAIGGFAELPRAAQDFRIGLLARRAA